MLIGLVLAGGGCARGGSDKALDELSGPDRSLAARPAEDSDGGGGDHSGDGVGTDDSLGDGSGSGNPSGGDRGTGDGSGSDSSSGGAAGPGGSDGGDSGSPPAPRTIARAEDPSGDTLSPAHADLVAVELIAIGDRAQVRVTFGARVPEHLEEDEVMGVGVDLFRSGERESDHQLFVDGSGDGWYAYLQTPDGFVTYPGTFRLDGSSMVHEVPWSSLGNVTAGELSVFTDWSKALLVANRSGDDRLPNRGRLPFTR